jgi:hypothetical protein
LILYRGTLLLALILEKPFFLNYELKPNYTYSFNYVFPYQK